MNTYYVAGIPFDGIDAISHHGIKGQKWGVRRYQNSDGTLTEEGLIRYSKSKSRKRNVETLRYDIDRYNKALNDMQKYGYKNGGFIDKKRFDKAFEQYGKMYDEISKYEDSDFKKLREKYLNKRKPELDLIRDADLAKKYGYDKNHSYGEPELDELAYMEAEDNYFRSIGIDPSTHYSDLRKLSYTIKDEAKKLSQKIVKDDGDFQYREVLAKILEDSVYNDWLKEEQELFK